jgi:hypothetical protein
MTVERSNLCAVGEIGNKRVRGHGLQFWFFLMAPEAAVSIFDADATIVTDITSFKMGWILQGRQLRGKGTRR